MTVLEVLKKARKLISKRKSWTVDEMARDKHGDAVASDSAAATCWCSMGAVRRVGGYKGPGNQSMIELRTTLKSRGSYSIAEFNDRSKHRAVLYLFDKTIARLEA